MEKISKKAYDIEEGEISLNENKRSKKRNIYNLLKIIYIFFF